eukprot:12595202-Prorocentrum_lima.AAC.1
MHVLLRTIEGAAVWLTCEPENTIRDLLLGVAEVSACSPDDMALILNGQVLDPDFAVLAYSIREGSTLCLLYTSDAADDM